MGYFYLKNSLVGAFVMIVFGLATLLLLVMRNWLEAVFSFTRLVSKPKLHPAGYKKIKPATILHRSRRKPDWALKELTRLKAHMPDAGCRTLADTFNRLFAHRQILVCKSTPIGCCAIRRMRCCARVSRCEAKPLPGCAQRDLGIGHDGAGRCC